MHSPGEKIVSSSAVIVRRMSASDISAALSILGESPEASIWSGESLRESVTEDIAWAAEADGRVAGILVGRIAADEFEILNLAVAKAVRRQGIAKLLISAALESARAEGARHAYLEVRSSNEAAIALYARLGFQVCGRRPNYYRKPVEDAVLLGLHN
jgi:ribosomal-protein-alanine N-acetyltransferase